MSKLTKEELEEIWRRSLDVNYTTPIEEEDDGRGFDIISGMSAIWKKVSDVINNLTQAFYIVPHSNQTDDPASGAVQATGQITITRTIPNHGTLELLSGDRLEVYQLGTKGEEIVVGEIELVNDETLPEASTTPVVADVIAVRPGTQMNTGPRQSVRFRVRAVASTPDVSISGNTLTDSGVSDRFTEDMVGAFVRFVNGLNATTFPRRVLTATLGTITVDGPALVTDTSNVEVVDLNDLGVNATVSTDLTGGKHPWLDLLGAERLQGRSLTDTDATYRERIQLVPDVVSPNAVYRAVSRILTPLSIAFEIFEPRTPDDFRGWFWDQDPFDDPASGLPQTRNLFLADGMQYRGFVVMVERSNLGEFGFPWDTNPATSGFPDNAWDWFFFDGYPITFWNALTSLIDEINRTKAFGVPYVIAVVDSL